MDSRDPFSLDLTKGVVVRYGPCEEENITVINLTYQLFTFFRLIVDVGLNVDLV